MISGGRGEERVLQTRHDKGKCTYECTPDWLRDGFHGDQFARPGEVVAAASTTATATTAIAAAATAAATTVAAAATAVAVAVAAAAVTATTGAAFPGKSYYL